MPNLLSALPVEIFSCVPASMSGLTLKAIGACLLRLTAILLIDSNSDTLSILNCNKEDLSASAISKSCFPTPENTILFWSIPAFNARWYSPSETTSAPPRSLAIVSKTERFELALTE